MIIDQLDVAVRAGAAATLLLPAALLLRPFNFDTLATHVYQFVSDEMLERGALGAIVIVLVGLLPLIWVNRTLDSPGH